MKAGEILIDGIFNGSRLLEIPFYQRAYVWKEEQWERFLADMQYVTKTKKQYFLGSIILKSGRELNTWDKYSECKTIIDGQQRITTLMLFMKALCLLKNENRLFERDFVLEDGTIALSHGRNDFAAFQKVMNLTSADVLEGDFANSQIISAFNYFVKNISVDLLDRTIIKQKVQFVCIDLAEDEDEQQVFDTINSLGVKLTTSELLKNYFFNKDNVDEYEEKWVSVFEKDIETIAYWDTEIESGRLKRALIDVFFDAYFQMFIQNKKYNISTEDKIMYSRIDNLAKSYQHFVNTYCDGNKSIIIDDMKSYAECFAKIFNPDYCNMGIPSKYGVERINIIVFGLKNSTLIPYLLYLSKNIDDETEYNKMCGILESYIMRRMVVHATTKNYNNLFTSLILNKTLDSKSLINRLKTANDSTTYIPSDDDVSNGFHNYKLYNLQTKGILYLIESMIRPYNSSTAILGFNSYSLEHMMPKKWRNNWSLCDTDELAKQRDSVILTLGNLAIIPQSLNSSIRDANWQTKKSGKGDKPGLLLCANGMITVMDALNKDEWNEEEIFLRANWLSKKAIDIWKFED